MKNYDADFPTFIRKVKVTGDSIVYHGDLASLPKEMTLNYAFNALQFEFAAPFFDDESRTLYSYQLVGFDEHWSEWNSMAEKEYTNLYEGDYVFQVKAKNIYDMESRTDTYAFTAFSPHVVGLYLLSPCGRRGRFRPREMERTAFGGR